MMSFLSVWQLIFSAPLSIASGCLGIARYAEYVWPSLSRVLLDRSISLGVPHLGALDFHVFISTGTFVPMARCFVALRLLYRRVWVIGQMARYLSVGVLGAILLVIVAGLTHFNAARAFSFPPGAFHFGSAFVTGLGSAMLLATYDYWGYYNVCFLGGEIKQPERNIPRAILYSIVIVAVLFLVVDLSILGVMPWEGAGPGGGPGGR